jgi:hypothetical protein
MKKTTLLMLGVIVGGNLGLYASSNSLYQDQLKKTAKYIENKTYNYPSYTGPVLSNGQSLGRNVFIGLLLMSSVTATFAPVLLNNQNSSQPEQKKVQTGTPSYGTTEILSNNSTLSCNFENDQKVTCCLQSEDATKEPICGTIGLGLKASDTVESIHRKAETICAEMSATYYPDEVVLPVEELDVIQNKIWANATLVQEVTQEVEQNLGLEATKEEIQYGVQAQVKVIAQNKQNEELAAQKEAHDEYEAILLKHEIEKVENICKKLSIQTVLHVSVGPRITVNEVLHASGKSGAAPLYISLSYHNETWIPESFIHEYSEEMQEPVLTKELMRARQVELYRQGYKHITNNDPELECILSTVPTTGPCYAIYLENFDNSVLPTLTQEDVARIFRAYSFKYISKEDQESVILQFYKNYTELKQQLLDQEAQQ